MPFFEEVGERVSRLGSAAARGAKNMNETVRLKGKISEEKSRINSMFQQIGKIYYENGGGSDPQADELTAGIDRSKEIITACAEQLRKLRGRACCPSCGGEVKDTMPFCGLCGSPMAANTATNPAQPGKNGINCPQCGVFMVPDKVFCTKCGKKLQPEKEPEGEKAENSMPETI